MELDLKKLRRLVFVASQRRVRYCAMPLPASSKHGEPDFTFQMAQIEDARLRLVEAQGNLLNYLEQCLDIPKEPDK